MNLYCTLKGALRQHALGVLVGCRLAGRAPLDMLRAFDPSWAKSAHWRACNNKTILPRLHSAEHTATAHAQAFLDRCALDAAQWTFSDSCGYFAAAWPVNDSACTGEALHVGPRGDGGKEVCRPADLYSSLRCTIVSVGLNGDTRFEQAIMAASSCAIHGYDGTLVAERAKLRSKLPQRIAATNATFTFNAVNFGVETWRQFAGTHVSMLKIDCEGCEWKDLPPWLENVCTDQILIEIHTGTGKFPCDPGPAGTELSRVLRFHHLFALLDAHGYSQFFYEPNVRKARYCGEYAFVRRMPCHDRYHTR